MASEGALSVEATVERRMIRGAWTYKRLLYLLGSLAAYDDEIERKMKRTGWTAGLSFLALIIFLISWSILEWNGLGAAAAIAAITSLVSYIFYRNHDKKDLPNDFRLYLTPLMKMLSDDIKEKSKISVIMDISNIQDKKHSRGTTNLPITGPYYKITAEKFQRDLLTLGIQLGDGNRVVIRRREFLTVITKKKQNQRGKYKTKMKYKRMVTMRMRLLVSPKSYRILKPKDEGKSGVAAFSQRGRKGLLDHRSFEEGDLKMVLSYGLTLDQMAGLYSRLVRVEKGKGGRETV